MCVRVLVQTGTGKTFTMSGDGAGAEGVSGMCVRTLLSMAQGDELVEVRVRCPCVLVCVCVCVCVVLGCLCQCVCVRACEA